jgi:anti-sigma B factor antagonist
VPTRDLAPSSVDVQTARFGDIYVMVVSGELDQSGSDSLRVELERVHRLRGRALVVDLLGVPFVDSTALGILVGAAKRLRSARGRIILVADDPRTIRVFQDTGLDGVFTLEHSLSAAIDAAVAIGKEEAVT